MKISNPFLKFNFVKSVAVRNEYVKIKQDQSKRSWTDKIINLILFKPTLSENDKLVVSNLCKVKFTLITNNFGDEVYSTTPNSSIQLSQIADIFHRVIQINKNEVNEQTKNCPDLSDENNVRAEEKEAKSSDSSSDDISVGFSKNDIITALKDHYNAGSDEKVKYDIEIADNAPNKEFVPEDFEEFE